MGHAQTTGIGTSKLDKHSNKWLTSKLLEKFVIWGTHIQSGYISVNLESLEFSSVNTHKKTFYYKASLSSIFFGGGSAYVQIFPLVHR